MLKKIGVQILLFYFLLCVVTSAIHASSDEIEEFYDQAVEFEALERYNEAIEMYLKISEKSPEYIAPLIDLANIYSQTGKTEEALQTLRKVLRINPSNTKALSRMGLIYIQKGDYPAALGYLNQALAIKPDLVEIQINFSKFYYAQNMYKDAVIFGRKATILDSNSPEAFLVTGMAYAKNREYREAIRQFIHVMEIDHNTDFASIAIQEIERLLNILKKINADVQQGTDLYNSKKFDEAREIFKNTLKEDAGNPEAYNGLANIASFVDQNNDQAVQLFSQAINYNPNYIYGYSGLALVHLVKEDIESVRYVTNKIKIININRKLFSEESQSLKMLLENIPEMKNDLQILIEAYDFVEYGEAYIKIKELYNKLKKQEQASKFYQEGNKYLKEEQYNQALQEFKTALQLYPNSKRIKEKWMQALRELRVSINKKEGNPEGHYTLANTLRIENKVEEAEKEYIESLRLDPDFSNAPGAHYWLGVIYEKQKRYELAQNKFELVTGKYIDYLKKHYLLLDAYWKLGNIYNFLGNFDNSIKTLEQAIKRDPRWFYLYIDLADVYINKKVYPPAIEQIKYVFKKSPGHEMAEEKLKEIYIKMGYDEKRIKTEFDKLYTEIIIELENEKRSNPNSKNLSLLLGKAYIAQEQYGKAINEFNIYLDRFPGDKKIELQLLSIYRKLNFTPSEISRLELKLKRTLLAEEYFNKGNELYRKRDFEEALKHFNNAIKIKENFVKAQIRIGDCYVSLQKYNEAVKEYKQLLSLAPNIYEVYSNLAYIFNIQGFYDRAIEECDKAIKINPYFPNSYNNMGYAYMKKGLYEEAIREFEKAIELSPNYSNAIRNLEKTKNLLGKTKDNKPKNE
ncbi:MAG: tetratricopeptide repeat protein [Candidatus Firestonebacteria bacterium]|nr:tetratricopeptide repeat protein [Candidatus Firestonebacteria bacterium]